MSTRRPSVLTVPLLVLGLAASRAEAAGPVPSGATTKGGAMQMQCLKGSQLRVTLGEIGRDSSGRLEIAAPKVRAVSTVGRSRAAELKFTFLGPTKEQSVLRSGQVREQFGLKLRALNGCNLVYAIWRVTPKAELVISVKSNPGLRTNAECHTNGYENIKPTRSAPLPVLRPGEPHTMRAVLASEGDGMEVFVDDVSVWSGQLGQKALAFDGPVGLRTDNAHLIAELCQAPVATGADADASSGSGEGDE